MTTKSKPVPEKTTAEPRKYTVADPDDMLLGDLFFIKSRTGVDVVKAPTVMHQHAALIWHASQSTDEPLSWDYLGTLPMSTLIEMIQRPDQLDGEDGDEVPDDGRPEAVEGKASTTSDRS